MISTCSTGMAVRLERGPSLEYQDHASINATAIETPASITPPARREKKKAASTSANSRAIKAGTGRFSRGAWRDEFGTYSAAWAPGFQARAPAGHARDASLRIRVLFAPP